MEFLLMKIIVCANRSRINKLVLNLNTSWIDETYTVYRCKFDWWN